MAVQSGQTYDLAAGGGAMFASSSCFDARHAQLTSRTAADCFSPGAARLAGPGGAGFVSLACAPDFGGCRDGFGASVAQTAASTLPGAGLPCRFLDSSCGPSTSGRAPAGGRSVLEFIRRQSLEIDAVVRLEGERLRAGLEVALRQQWAAATAAAEIAAARQLAEKSAELERSRARCLALEERLRQLAAEAQAWCGVARSHEVVACGLRASLQQLQSSTTDDVGAADAEDAQSCCVGPPPSPPPMSARQSGRCRVCGKREACVLVLPCRHLGVCVSCEGAAAACPVCGAAKSAELRVFFA